MTPLLRKEIRLLLPAWAVALVTATMPLWLGPDYLDMTRVLFAVGVLFLALAPFGQEMAFGTLNLLLTQPEQRRRWWNIKTGLCALALISTWLVRVFFLGVHFSLFHRFEHPLFMEGTVDAIITLVAFAGGLWTTVLLREMIPAFLVSVISPIACLIVIQLPLLFSGSPSYDSADFANLILRCDCWLLCLYSVAGFWLGRTLFLRAQDVPWTGGDVSFSHESGARLRIFAAGFRQKCGPRLAFARKELLKQQVVLLLVPWLVAAHLAAIAARHFYPLSGDVRGCLDSAWILWLVVPAVVGSVGVAQERRLNTQLGDLVLPFSAVNQFFIKFALALVLGLGLGGGIPCLLEVGATAVGLPSQSAGLDFMIGAPLVITLIAFFASTLTDGLLPAFVATLSIALGITGVQEYMSEFSGFAFYHRTIFICMAWPVMTIAFLCLAYRNSKAIRTSPRLWLRNLIVALLVFAFIADLSEGIYNRAWELVLPLEPRHGTARFSGRGPSTIAFYAGGPAVLLPDGRLWIGRTRWQASDVWTRNNPPSPRGVSGAFIPGTNWVGLSGGYQCVAIKSDGTLWNVYGTNTSQIGSDSHWKKVKGLGWAPWYLALKEDGSLWWWGEDFSRIRASSTNHGVAGLLNVPTDPVRFRTDSDWSDIFATGLQGQVNEFLVKQDGSFWGLRLGAGRQITSSSISAPFGIFRDDFGLKGTNWMSVVNLNDERYPFCDFLGIQGDGTLWAIGQFGSVKPPAAVRVGDRHDWLQLSAGHYHVAAIESNGTLSLMRTGSHLAIQQANPRDVNFPVEQGADGRFADGWMRVWELNFPVEQQGKYSDWIGVATDYDGTWALAADGTLCRWRENWRQNWVGVPIRERRLLRITRGPVIAINILDSH